MVDNYRRSIKFEEPEDHVALSGQEREISKHCEDVVGDAGDLGAAFDDALMCVVFYYFGDQITDWSISFLLGSRMRILSCR